MEVEVDWGKDGEERGEENVLLVGQGRHRYRLQCGRGIFSRLIFWGGS